MNASDTYKSVVSFFSWSFNLSEMYIPKVEDRQMTTTSVLFLSHGDGYAVLSKIRFSFESLMTPAVGVLSADGAQLRAESPPRNCTELKGSASPRGSQGSTLHLMTGWCWSTRAGPFNYRHFWSAVLVSEFHVKPSQTSVATALPFSLPLCSVCLLLLLYELELSLKAVPHDPPAHNLHLRVCLPESKICNSY